MGNSHLLSPPVAIIQVARSLRPISSEMLKGFAGAEGCAEAGNACTLEKSTGGVNSSPLFVCVCVNDRLSVCMRHRLLLWERKEGLKKVVAFVRRQACGGRGPPGQGPPGYDCVYIFCCHTSFFLPFCNDFPCFSIHTLL